MKTMSRVAIIFFELGVVKNFIQNSMIDCNSIIYQCYRVSDTYFLKILSEAANQKCLWEEVF